MSTEDRLETTIAFKTVNAAGVTTIEFSLAIRDQSYLDAAIVQQKGLTALRDIAEAQIKELTAPPQ